jgi:superfamily II DNA or RNA helicase
MALMIEIDNSYSKVSGYTPEQFKELKKALSYETDSSARYFAGRNYPSRRYLIDNKGYFPTGLMSRVASVVPNATLVDKRIVPKPEILYQWRGPAPYAEQTAAAHKAFFSNYGGIVAPTGSGKSIIIALIIARMCVRTLVVVPNLELKEQLRKTLIECLGANAKYVTVENIASPKLKTLTTFDCLILDECHHAASKTYRALNKTAWKGIYHRFFLTATYFRNNPDEQMLFDAICWPPIYEITYRDSVQNGYIVPLEAYYINIPKQNTEAFIWAEVYKELVVQNKIRNEKIIDLLTRLKLGGKYTLCLVKEVAHGKILSNETGIPFVSGQDDESRQHLADFSAGRIKSVIATSGIAGEGVDTKPAEYVVVAGLGKAKSAFMQQCGRVLRRWEGKESGKVVLFKDKSHKYLLRHFNSQVNVLKTEYGIKPETLEL